MDTSKSGVEFPILPRELVMDILKHGAEVEVIEPKTLRDEVASQLRLAAQQYSKETK